MSRRISDKTKDQRGMGTGIGDNYKPRIIEREFNSLGTTSVIRDWKGKRGIHCMSQGEAMWYYILRWDDNNVQIYEQYPLENSVTTAIAEKIGFKHPLNNSHIMTTDFVAEEADGSYHAYAVKDSRNLDDRTLEILAIEKLYWRYKHTKFTLLFKTDVNRILYNNIRLVVGFYDPNSVFDKYSAIKHKIAVKEYKCDMGRIILDTAELDRIWEENK